MVRSWSTHSLNQMSFRHDVADEMKGNATHEGFRQRCSHNEALMRRSPAQASECYLCGHHKTTMCHFGRRADEGQNFSFLSKNTQSASILTPC